MAGIGAAVFALSLVVNGIAGRMLHVDIAHTRPADMPTSIWLVGLVGTVALASLAGWWYFSSREGDLISGLQLGLVWVLVGIFLDVVFILPLKHGSQLLLGYFRQWQYWLTLLTLVGTCISFALIAG